MEFGAAGTQMAFHQEERGETVGVTTVSLGARPRLSPGQSAQLWPDPHALSCVSTPAAASLAWMQQTPLKPVGNCPA